MLKIGLVGMPLLLLKHWGYLMIFLFGLVEALPFIGVFIPGQTAIIIAGFLARLQVFRLWEVILIASIGAIIGDYIGYFMGRRYGPSIISRFGKYFFLKKENADKLKRLVKNHAGKSIIFGRFNSLTRPFAPIFAGFSEVGLLKFSLYNILGGISWAIIFVGLGFVLGASYETFSKYIGRFIFFATIISIALIYFYYIINKYKHIFAKYHLHILIANIFSLYILSKMMDDVLGGEWITKIDVLINSKIIGLWNPILNKLMILISQIANTWVLIFLSLFVIILLIYKKRWHDFLIYLFSLGGGAIAVFLLKNFIQRPRPIDSLIQASGYSFPSGPAANSIIFFLLMIYLFKKDIKNNIVKRLFIFSGFVLPLIIGLSRIYLRLHWTSDVIAGFSIGLFWLTFSILLFKFIWSFKKILSSVILYLSKR